MKTKLSRKFHLPKPDFKMIMRDVAYLTSIGSAFCIGLGLFFPCTFVLLRLWAIPFISHSDRFLFATVCDWQGDYWRTGFLCGTLLLASRPILVWLTTKTAQVTILNAGSSLGRVLPNIFADKIGPYNTLIPCLLTSSVLAFSIFGIHSFAGVGIFGFLYGFWSGSCEDRFITF